MEFIFYILSTVVERPSFSLVITMQSTLKTIHATMMKSNNETDTIGIKS
jgi:hypothetical protein